MKVIKRNTIIRSYVSVMGESKTETGLVQPISKLVERYRQGKEVPKLANNLPFSVPIANSFSSDLIDVFKFNQQYSTSLKELNELMQKQTPLVPEA